MSHHIPAPARRDRPPGVDVTISYLAVNRVHRAGGERPSRSDDNGCSKRPRSPLDALIDERRDAVMRGLRAARWRCSVLSFGRERGLGGERTVT
jgi:hypothetical protein